MRPGSLATYKPISLPRSADYEGMGAVSIECLDRREIENGAGDPVRQWHLRVRLKHIESEDYIVEDDVTISIVDQTDEVAYHKYDRVNEVLCWMPEEDSRQSMIGAMQGATQPDYPWAVNHDKKLFSYTCKQPHGTITDAILHLLEEIDPLVHYAE